MCKVNHDDLGDFKITHKDIDDGIPLSTYHCLLCDWKKTFSGYEFIPSCPGGDKEIISLQFILEGHRAVCEGRRTKCIG